MKSVYFISLLLGSFWFGGCLNPEVDIEEFYNKPFKLVQSSCPSTFTGANAANQVTQCLNNFSCYGQNVTLQNFAVVTFDQMGRYQRSIFVSNIGQGALDIAFEPDVTGWGGRYTVADGLIQLQRVNSEGNLRCIPGNCDEAVANYSLSGQKDSLKLSLSWHSSSGAGSRCVEKYELWSKLTGPFSPR